MEGISLGQKDIAETVTLSGDFSIFSAALNAAGLVDVLKGGGAYTIFAPTDEAFASLPMGTLDYLFKPENKAILTCLLKYHVVSGRITAEEITGCNEVKTLNGEVLAVASKYGKVQVDCATITIKNIECSNGVIHAIDLVAIPKRWL
jgi:uncharacterized surface protein with fasciclin (FAS1) repeats